MPAIALTNDQKKSKQKEDSRQKKACGGNRSYTQIKMHNMNQRNMPIVISSPSVFFCISFFVVGRGAGVESINTKDVEKTTY